MPRQSGTSATPATATPPAAENGFAFANGDFFASSSGHNLHRRAKLPELKEHFTSGSDKDHPAHWFEAQLIHYGLPPSKTKSVARMRLFDAVNGGKLTVAADVSKLEGKLKKEWTKNDREAKKAHKEGAESKSKATTKATTATKTTNTITAKKTAGTKRKANDTVNTASTSTISSQPAAKKAKATPAKKGPQASTASNTRAASARPPRTKQTARCTGRGNLSQGPSRSASTALPPPAPTTRPPQMARRSGAFMARGRIPAPQASPRLEAWGVPFDNNHDEPPPPYSDFGYDSDPYGQDSGSYSPDDDFNSEEAELRPLGLLNGSYDMTSSEVSSQWPSQGSEFEFVFTIAGSSMWASFDLGIVEGIMYFAQRPMTSSHERVNFIWRGQEAEGPISYGNRNTGWIKFLGDGRIEGQIDFMSIDFRGRRVPGQGTRSAVDANTLRREWEGYSEEEYERQRVARWH